MNEKVILVKAKGDINWSVKSGGFDFWDVYIRIPSSLSKKDFEYIEIKPCCCIVERLVFLEGIEKYGITREEVPSEYIIL